MWHYVLHGLGAILFFIAVGYALSEDRRAINWRLVATGMALQLLFAFLVLGVPQVRVVFEYIAGVFQAILVWSEAGGKFLFGDMATDASKVGYIFAFRVLPTIIFFSVFSAILMYYGLLQRLVKAFAWVMSRLMSLSGPESIAAAANIFLGQTESPLIIRPYIKKMSRSELFCLMTGGMATIAGGGMAAYIGMLGADVAVHLLAASIMSAPAAIVMAKIMVPEQIGKALDSSLQVEIKLKKTLLGTINKSTSDGLKLAVNVGAMLLVFTALIAMANALLSNSLGRIPIGNGLDLNSYVQTHTARRMSGFDFSYLISWPFSVVAWIMGVPTSECLAVGQLLGYKTVINEFVAYGKMFEWQEAGMNLSPRARIIAVYALCGFSNFASIGIQIGGIGFLAKNQRKHIINLGLKSLIAGSIACFLTASIAGMLTK
jgi:CNT family concentrative nucleoside transporter